MRILQVIMTLQKAAGTSVFCGELANELVAKGHEVTIAAVDPTAPDCYPLDPRIALVSLDSILRSPPPPTFSTFSLVHIHALWSPILTKVSKWAHANKIPVVWSPHGMLTPWAMHNKRAKKLLGWWLYQRAALRQADLLHATAQSEVEDIRGMGLKNKVVVAPLGVNVCRVEVEKCRDRKTLLFVSRVQRKKGLPNLLEAWSRLPESLRAGWTIRIVGPDQDNHTAELKAQCDRLGLTDVVFVGPKFGDALTKEYASADLFVLPTHSENFGSVVIESLAQGVPVICTKGAPWEELETHHCGWWIDIGVQPLVTALRAAFAASADELKRLGENGRGLVRSKYTWQAVASTMEESYTEVSNG